MKKSAVTINFDEEKLSAIKIYMDKKGLNIEEELTSQLENLFSKLVPLNVRNYISDRHNDGEQDKKRPDGK